MIIPTAAEEESARADGDQRGKRAKSVKPIEPRVVLISRRRDRPGSATSFGNARPGERVRDGLQRRKRSQSDRRRRDENQLGADGVELSGLVAVVLRRYCSCLQRRTK